MPKRRLTIKITVSPVGAALLLFLLIFMAMGIYFLVF